MSESLPLIFRVFQIVIPTFAVIVFCTALCKCVLQSRKRRREQRQLAQASARAQQSPASIYIIPISTPEEEEDYRPPRYSQTQPYAPPPAYNELVAKPDLPHDPPPAYSESISPPFISSYPGQISPSSPTLPE